MLFHNLEATCAPFAVDATPWSSLKYNDDSSTNEYISGVFSRDKGGLFIGSNLPGENDLQILTI